MHIGIRWDKELEQKEAKLYSCFCDNIIVSWASDGKLKTTQSNDNVSILEKHDLIFLVPRYSQVLSAANGCESEGIPTNATEIEVVESNCVSDVQCKGFGFNLKKNSYYIMETPPKVGNTTGSCYKIGNFPREIALFKGCLELTELLQRRLPVNAQTEILLRGYIATLKKSVHFDRKYKTCHSTLN